MYYLLFVAQCFFLPVCFWFPPLEHVDGVGQTDDERNEGQGGADAEGDLGRATELPEWMNPVRGEEAQGGEEGAEADGLKGRKIERKKIDHASLAIYDRYDCTP